MIKRIATWLLLLFATTALVVKIVAVNVDDQEPTVLPKEGNLVLFFYQSARCPTCNLMQALIEGVLEKQEYDDLGIELVLLESDSAKNAELVAQFRVIGLGLALMERRLDEDGEIIENYINLTPQAWETINTRNERFVEMFETNLSEFYRDAFVPSKEELELGWWLAFLAVLVLGLRMAISPCPLATNIAAVSYISRRVQDTREVMFSGLLYTLGRALTFVVLAVCLLAMPGVFAPDQVMRYFSEVASIFLGPVMMVVGIVLLGWLTFPLPSFCAGAMQTMVDRLGKWSAFPLGVVLALAFCPPTAGMFLLMLVLAANYDYTLFFFPLMFGICSTLPFLLLAGIIAYQARHLSKIVSALKNIDLWMCTIAGIIFILVATFLSLRFNFGVPIPGFG